MALLVRRACVLVHAHFAERTCIYDELFAVDSTSYREAWREHLSFDCSRREYLAVLTSELPASLGLNAIGARYAAGPGDIGVSYPRLEGAA